MNERKGYVLVASAAALWGTSGTIVKLLYDYHFDSFSLAFLRSLFAFAIAAGVAAVFRPLCAFPFANYPFSPPTPLSALAYSPLSITRPFP